MPMPVYFEVGGREVSVTDDEARALATRLPSELELQHAIMLRVGVSASSLVRLDIGGDEQRNLIALCEAIESLEQDGELSPAVKLLRRLSVASLEAH
jgi:hypothetical protein